MTSMKADEVLGGTEEERKATQAKEAIKARVKNCPAPQTLTDHTEEFEKKVYKVTDGVHVAVGFGIANSILIEAPDGLIIVDTTEGTVSMEPIWKEFRKISDKPVKGVIYTHSHSDHFKGTEAFSGALTEDVEIWAHHKFLEIRKQYEALLRGAMLPRNIRQFGMGLVAMDAVINCGIGPKIKMPQVADKTIWPNKLMEGEGTQDITIAGLDLKLVYIPGETQCQMGVWIPSKKVFLPADDFYKTFPNLYAIRGTVPRSITCWFQSLDVMRNLYPEHLVPSHSRPVSGQAEIQTQLTNYRDAIQFVHDQTLRLMNRGMHPVDVAKSIHLPPSLRDLPYLRCFYGTPEWSSKAVFDSYIGWFSGNPEELMAFSPTERGKRMVDSFGAEQILREAELAMTEQDLQWALELSTHVFLCDPGNTEAKNIRTRAILGLASQQTSSNGRNYLLTCLLEDHGVHPKRYPTAQVVLELPLDVVFRRMASSLKAENVEDVTMTAVITFQDINETYTFYIRNCVLEVEKLESGRRDLCVWMHSSHLRSILAGVKTTDALLADKSIDLDQEDALLVKFFSYFELGDEWDAKTNWKGFSG